MSFGPHFILDGYGCKRNSLIDLEHVYDFLDKLPERIGMTKISQPHVFKYSGVKPQDWGVTGTVILAESHCSFHSFPERHNFITIDCYSCKFFDPNLVLEVIQEYFGPQDYEYHVIERGEQFCRQKCCE